MPLTDKGRKIMASMKKEYGDKGKEVFYASKNKGSISGVDKKKHMAMAMRAAKSV